MQLAVAQHHAVQGADLIGILHLCLDAASHQVALDGVALPTELGGQAERLLCGGIAHRGDVKIALLRLRKITALLLHHHDESLQTHGKADPFHIGTAKLTAPAAVTPAAAQCGKPGNGDLKDGAGVVIQPADDAGIDRKGNIGVPQQGLYLFKVVPAVIAEVIQYTGRALGDLAADGGFAVQNAHGVFLQTLLAGFAQFLPTALKVGAQRLVVFGAAGGAADGIDGKGQILQPEGLHTLPRQRNDLGIGDGLGGAVAFHAELMELAEASALGFFIAEAVEHITDLEGQGIAQKTVFNRGAADTGGTLRTQGDGAVALIGKGVHFLADHIGGIPYPALEQLGMLEGRGTDLAVAVQRGSREQGTLDILPAGGLGGEKIIGAAGAGGEDRHRLLPSLLRNGGDGAGLWFILA